jgi:hypothetical protein
MSCPYKTAETPWDRKAQLASLRRGPIDLGGHKLSCQLVLLISGETARLFLCAPCGPMGKKRNETALLPSFLRGKLANRPALFASSGSSLSLSRVASGLLRQEQDAGNNKRQKNAGGRVAAECKTAVVNWLVEEIA